MRSGEPPRVLVGRSRAVYAGPGMALSPHANAVATFVVGLEAAFSLGVEGVGESSAHRARIALVPPRIRHRLVSSGALACVYLDVSAKDCRDWSERRAGVDDAAVIASVRDALESGDGRGTSLRIERIGDALDVPAPTVRHAAVERAVRSIDRSPQSFALVRQAADLAELSVSRFQHVFRDVTGTSFRQYRLWRRMGIVAAMLADSRSLTEAAMAAGFASPSHLSVAFRAMFGLRPSDLLAAGTRFEVDRDAARA